MRPELANLTKDELVKMFFDSLHLIILHYSLWFRESEHQIGLDKAIKADEAVWPAVLNNLARRLAGNLDIPLKNGLPEAFFNLSKEELETLLEDMAKGWVACDGIWFQEIEQNYDCEMFTAKRINDTNWFRFSYIEARQIMKNLNLPENGGLAALKEALKYRQYALINKQEIIETDGKIIFRMNDCRVQSARKNRNLPDYPCKSAGVVEYARFAEGIDPCLQVKCIGCPPDAHPADWWCAWEFSLKQ